jgi:hypothetical protein
MSRCKQVIDSETQPGNGKNVKPPSRFSHFQWAIETL